MRFSDAVERMEGYTGVIVHRSHWVAAHAVLSVQKNGGRFFALLSNGNEVPVSRGRLTEVEQVLGPSVLAA
jgi:DNA-binding LytR/AlgR family response regulator